MVIAPFDEKLRRQALKKGTAFVASNSLTSFFSLSVLYQRLRLNYCLEGCVLHSSTLKAIEKVLKAEGKVKPSFDEYCVLKALMTLYEEEPVGRLLLSRKLKMGEAATRTLIRRLRKEGLIAVDSIGGCFLSDAGKKLVSNIRKVVKEVKVFQKAQLGSLALGNVACAASIACGCKLFERGLRVFDLRDEVVRFGGLAALIVKIEHGEAILPANGGQVFSEKDYPELKMLKTELKADEGDLIIVAYADSEEAAEKALLNALVKGKVSAIFES